MRQIGRCRICNEGGDLYAHHYSYKPERTILICKECHQEIHRGSLYKLDPTKVGNAAIKYAEGLISGEIDPQDLINSTWGDEK